MEKQEELEAIEAEEEEKIPSVRCQNCGIIYTLKKGNPEICWQCGLPVEERINGI